MATATKEKTSLLAYIRGRLEGVNLRQNGIFLALIALILFFAATTPNAASLTPGNWSNLVVQNGYILVLAIGMVMIIIAGHIDLSVGSVACFIGAVAGILAVRPLEQSGWGWLPALPWWAYQCHTRWESAQAAQRWPYRLCGLLHHAPFAQSRG